MLKNESHTIAMRRLRTLENQNKKLARRIVQLEKRAQRYRHFYEKAPVGMYEIDFVSGRCLSVNCFVLAYTGYTREEFLAMNPADFIAEASRDLFGEHYEKIQCGEEARASVELQIRCKKGPIRWALFEIQDARVQGLQAASVVFYTMDEHKRALKALAESEQRFRRLVETMKEGLIILDRDGRLIYVNQHLEEISGYNTEELIGHEIEEFLSPEGLHFLQRRLSGQDENLQRAFEIAWKRKNGELRYSIISPQVLPGGDDGSQETFAIITDITAKKKAEDAVRRREKELRHKNDQLAEMNTALRMLAKLREQDKSEIENRVTANLQQLVEPLIEKLQNSGLNDRQKIYTQLLSANLKEITSSFNQRVSPHLLVLTPAEIEVANMVKHGRTTKEIASLMMISARTVDMHRLNIRRKLGLNKRSTNLRSYLLST
ncbi:MAG: PAS domain S-box protein [Deltaproteobacteria bacterium]|nr:PAS domain S-box protein [Deltaproteobacteria bacterium]